MSKPAASAITARSWLHVSTLLRLLAVTALVLAPHALRLPVWETLLCASVMLWRAAAALKCWPMPNKWLKAALTFAAFGAVYLSYGRVSGQHAGVALLVLMSTLKLSELQQRRDVMVTVFLLYFVCITHFLFSQELWTLLYLLAASFCITAVLIEANRPGAPLPVKVTGALAGRLLLQALPLMLLMFVLFPRVPGPLWGLPSDAGAARSGLSDRMSPGDIAGLILSDELAFRVRFDQAPPPRKQMYWRGPVFWDFDGREWTAGGAFARDPATVELEGAAIGYEVTLEPNRAHWLFALDFPDPRSLPPDAGIAPDGIVLARDEIKERRLYRLRSHSHYRLQPDLSERSRRAATRLPARRNPKAVALAATWRAQGMDDAAIIQQGLKLFREQEFFYTLKPPLLGSEPVDEFLFESRRGFCEHYASAYAVLMRAAGIPTRVVTGYQGGSNNLVGDYAVVRQSDAHAWVEVWQQGLGWQRIDPTAAVAPNRVEQGLSEALSLEESAPFALRRGSNRLYYQLEARWDWVNAQWNRWVLAYGPELQRSIFSRFGIEGWRDLMLLLTAGIALALSGFGLLALRGTNSQVTEERALKLWRKETKPLIKLGLLQRPNEGAQAFARRVVESQPAWATRMDDILKRYLAARYQA
jgi:transglutaminase-like putative cysteine protease